MKKLSIVPILSLLMLVFFLGCATELSIKSMTAEPSTSSPGDSVKCYVVLNQPTEKVKSVVGTVREYPSYIFAFNNNGENGDDKAGDNIWTTQYTVPWEAPSEEYHLDIDVLDNEGNRIISKEVEGETLDRSGTILVVVK